MLRLLMIADDFTGALDTGVQLAAHGIPTQVVVGQADLSACSSTGWWWIPKRGICPPQRLQRPLKS